MEHKDPFPFSAGRCRNMKLALPVIGKLGANTALEIPAFAPSFRNTKPAV